MIFFFEYLQNRTLNERKKKLNAIYSDTTAINLTEICVEQSHWLLNENQEMQQWTREKWFGR